MKTSKFYFDEKNNKIELWNENGSTGLTGLTYWKRVNGTSWIITKRQYENQLKKYSK